MADEVPEPVRSALSAAQILEALERSIRDQCEQKHSYCVWVLETIRRGLYTSNGQEVPVPGTHAYETELTRARKQAALWYDALRHAQGRVKELMETTQRTPGTIEICEDCEMSVPPSEPGWGCDRAHCPVRPTPPPSDTKTAASDSPSQSPNSCISSTTK